MSCLLCVSLLSPQIPEFKSQNTFLSKERYKKKAIRWFCVALIEEDKILFQLQNDLVPDPHCWYLVRVYEFQ